MLGCATAYSALYGASNSWPWWHDFFCTVQAEMMEQTSLKKLIAHGHTGDLKVVGSQVDVPSKLRSRLHTAHPCSFSCAAILKVQRV